MSGTSYRHGLFSSLSLLAVDLRPLTGWVLSDAYPAHADPSPNRYRYPVPHFHADRCSLSDVDSYAHAAARRAHHQRRPRLQFRGPDL